MKSYYEYINPLGFVFAIFFVLILLFPISWLRRKFKIQTKFYVFVFLLLFYTLFFLFTTYSSIVPNFPDTGLFAKIITENHFPPYSIGAQLFYYISFPIRVISLFSVPSFILSQIFIFIITLMFLWNSFELTLKNNNIDAKTGENIFFVLSFFYPSFLLFIPIPLREFLLLFGFSMFFNGLIRNYYSYDKKHLLLIIGSFLILFTRPQFIVIIIILFSVLQKNRKRRYILLGISFFLVPLIFTLVTNYTFSPSFFSYLRNSANEQYAESGFVYGIVEWKSYLDIIRDIPLLFLQFIFSPIPILHNIKATSMFAIFTDVVYCSLIYIFTLYAGFKVNKIYLLVFFVVGGIFSIWEFYIGGAVRHRIPIVAMLMPVAAFGISKFINRIKKGKL